MEVPRVSCMNPGDGKHSYASNSILQKTVILRGRQVLRDSIKELFSSKIPSSISVADLGCSSGPNTFLVLSEIIDTIHELCQQTNHNSPELHLFLNDLPDNDFNTVFRSLPEFYQKLKIEKGDKLGSCFISGRPGSFYERLFVSKGLHFIHSSYSVHWLSQVPKGIESNKGNIYMSKSSPANVYEAYKGQFERDFSKFLRLRSEEIIPGGRVVLTLIGRSSPDPTTNDCCSLWDLLTKSLLDLVTEGLVKEEDVDSFDLPFYTACVDEVKGIVEKEGSFQVSSLRVFETSWDPSNDICDQNYVFDRRKSGRTIANSIRAVLEPLLATHFGDGIIEKLFDKYSEHAADHLGSENTKFFNILVSMSNK